jgi:hypothetical protein
VSAVNNKAPWPDLTLTRRFLHTLTVNHKNAMFYERIGLCGVRSRSKNWLNGNFFINLN